jgi:hypothetical protein
MNSQMFITGAKHPNTPSLACEGVYLAHLSHASEIGKVSKANQEAA